MMEEIRALAEDRAAAADDKLLTVQNQTRLIAAVATHILKHREEFKPRPIDYPSPDYAADYSDTTRPFLMTAPGLSPAAIQEELSLIANIADVLQQMTVMNPGISGSYLGMEAGYIIMADSTTPIRRDFDPRTRDWYRGAKEKGDVFWTGVFADGLGRGAGISCAMPVYETVGGVQVFRGAAGSGIVLSDTIDHIINSTRIGKTGYAFILNGEGTVMVSPRGEGGDLSGLDYLHGEDAGLRELAAKMIAGERDTLRLTMNGRDMFVAFHPLATINWSFALAVPYDEVITPAETIKNDILSITQNVLQETDRILGIILLLTALVVLLVIALTILIANRLADTLTAPILELSAGARIIGGGNLEYRLAVKTGDEVEELAETFNAMIDDIGRITTEKERINSELTVASEIQNAMLPDIFPKFADNPFIEIDAKMESAREVGGDFYDLFFLDKQETTIVLVIADVSGKGVPAALFMVIAKTLIKQQMLQSGDPAAALEAVNRILCEDNQRSMFVTAFIASLDLTSGEMTYANGGHNPPLLSLAGAPYQYMTLKKGLPPGAIESSVYQRCSLRLHRGDKLYLYTDGISEAMNSAGEPWGNGPFLEAANRRLGLSPAEFDRSIREEARRFADGAEQSDDITSVAISYTGLGAFHFDRELTVAARTEELEGLLDWLEDFLEERRCPAQERRRIAVAAEELFINIASYAYDAGAPGEAHIRVGARDGLFVISVEDFGRAFNPLEIAPPGMGSSLQDRPIGGLGIFLARQWMDAMSYERREGANILTAMKRLPASGFHRALSD
jgi:sigma-B regulation protein RsbU (phosphoserine phosphatase)